MSTTVHRRPLFDIARPAPPGPRVSRPTIGVLSTYPPTQCGLATFSAALVGQLNRRPGTAGVVRIVDRPGSDPAVEIAEHLVNGSASSTARAVRRLNGFDAVVVQHEYGIYGGPDGSDVLDVVAGLRVPTIVVLHTVLQEPTPNQRRILCRLVDAADVLETMTETGRQPAWWPATTPIPTPSS